MGPKLISVGSDTLVGDGCRVGFSWAQVFWVRRFGFRLFVFEGCLRFYGFGGFTVSTAFYATQSCLNGPGF